MREKAVIGDVVSSWREHGEGRQTIAFCVDKAHARDLADEFEVDGIPAAVVVDETGDEGRADIFQRFETGQVKVLASVGVLAVGFNSPIAGCAILARPTLSTMLHIQQAGRVIRPHATNADAVILDHAANTLRHGLPIDFRPPSDLSMIDKRTDKKPRRAEFSDVVACRECDALYPRAEDACPECGTPRTRYTKAVVLDGALVRVSWDSTQPEPGGVTRDDVQRFYCEMLAVCAMKGWKPGAAWFKTCERFRLRPEFHDQTTNTLLPRVWRSNAGAIDPTQETLRWIENQRRQRYVIERASRQAAA